MKALFLGIAAALLLGSPQGMADELKVLSAGAMQRGLVTVAAKFKEQSGNQVQIRYATAPELKKIFSEAGAPADVILAPNPTLADLATAGKVSPDTQKEIGGVGSAVLIRLDAPVPDVANLAAFRRSLTEANALVYNRASIPCSRRSACSSKSRPRSCASTMAKRSPPASRKAMARNSVSAATRTCCTTRTWAA
jgi:ABC-type molybdate transport system substrate-binding protein